LIYGGAASEKTGGTPWDAKRGGDQDLIIRMGNVAGMIRARAGGAGDNLRKVSPPVKGVEPKRYWRAYLKDQFERRIVPLLQSLSGTALSRTKAAVQTEQNLVKQRRGAEAMTRPSGAELETCYESQKAMHEKVLKDQLEGADWAGE
jgi:hypothetical protein